MTIDILDYELRYKHDADVMNLVEFYKEVHKLTAQLSRHKHIKRDVLKLVEEGVYN